MIEDFENDLSAELVIRYHHDDDDNVSTLSLGDQSYILDLANQKQFREEIRQEEAMEDALQLFKTAVEEGAPKSMELFKTIIAQVLKELNEENREKDRLQDEWLETALQEELERRNRENNLGVSHHTAKSSFSRGDTSVFSAGVPSIYNGSKSTIAMRRQSTVKMLELDQKIHEEEKNILHKKIAKAEKLMQEIVDAKGILAAQETKRFKNLQKKIKEYQSTLKKAEKDDLKVSKHTHHSSMYDWGAAREDDNDDGDDDDTAFQGDDVSSSSSSCEEESEASNHSSDAEDLEWAKQVVAKLTLNSNDNEHEEEEDEEDSKEEVPVKEIKMGDLEKAKAKRTPHKNISFNTTMATTRRLSGFELRMKGRLSGRSNSLISANHHHLAVTKEEEEDEPEENETALVSEEGSTHSNTTPRDDNKTDGPQAPTIYSPGKRKSPSWKNTDVVSHIPTKHTVSENSLAKSITSPPLSEATTTRKVSPVQPTASPTKRIISAPPLSEVSKPKFVVSPGKALNPVTRIASPRRSIASKFEVAPPTKSSQIAKPPIIVSPRPAETASKPKVIEAKPVSPPEPKAAKDTSPPSSNGGKYTLEDFQQGRASEANLVDWELYLSDAEFEKHFEMSRDAYAKLPKWKQSNAKRRLRTW